MASSGTTIPVLLPAAATVVSNSTLAGILTLSFQIKTRRTARSARSPGRPAVRPGLRALTGLAALTPSRVAGDGLL
jgi:hypothetical protein